MFQIRFFLEKGVDLFSDSLNKIRANEINNLPFEKLNQAPFSHALNKKIEIKRRSFKNRYQMGIYLNELFLSFPREELLSNTGLWTWLSFFYFSELCPVNTDGIHQIKENARYIFNPDNYRNYYRHIILVSWDLLLLHKKFSRLMLHTPLPKHSDILEQLASRQNIITNQNLIKTAYFLYWDEKKDKPKKNSSNRNVPGNIRRLVSFVNQIELTYDLNAMPEEKILSILPVEFSLWQQ